jgi:tRNA nucleotidyltransferase (CCA-adding enzyme)
MVADRGLMDLVVTHINADFDALGSMVAARKLYPGARLAFTGSQERSVREFMSVYKDILDIESEKECRTDDVDRLIIVDTRHTGRIGKFKELAGKKGIEIHIYDHHPEVEGDVKADKDTWKSTGATITILVQMIKRRRKCISPVEATIMALGIYEETGNLTFPSTTVDDIEAAAFLLSEGADLRTVSHYLRRELTDDEMELLVCLLHSTEVTEVRGMKVAVAAVESSKYAGELAVITHKLLEIENFNVLFVVVKVMDKVQIVGRSRQPEIDVGSVLRKLGGGGHPAAAYCSIKNTTLGKVKRALISLIKKKIVPRRAARDIMSTPVCTVESSQCIEDVKRTMLSLQLNSMPVLEDGNLVGIVTSHDLDKAISQGFERSPVKGYMSGQPVTISPNASLYEIQRIILENGAGALPVLQKGRLVGIVTRTDLLRSLHRDLFLKPGLETARAQEEPANLSWKIQATLPPRVIEVLKTSGSIADQCGFNAFVAGGFVRDLVLGVPNFDVDLVVEGEGIAYARLLAAKFGAKIVTYQKFKTAAIVMKDGFRLDVATARTEYYEYPAALPTVKAVGSIRYDLYRRDFTINTMAIRLNRKRFGELIDFFGGMRDIKEKKIRILHNLSFVDDPTRIFRAVKFEQRYDFKIEENTEHLIETAVSMDMFKRVHCQRIRDEIIGILSEPSPLKGLLRMNDLHELRFIHPRMRLNKRLVRLLKTAQTECVTFRASYGNHAFRPWVVFLAILLSQLDRDELIEVCRKFCFSNEVYQKLIMVKVNATPVTHRLKSRKRMAPHHIYRLLKPLSYEVIICMRAMSSNRIIHERIDRFLHDYDNVKLKISGKNLLALGAKPGPVLGEILDELLYRKLDKGFETVEEELKEAKAILHKACLSQ